MFTKKFYSNYKNFFETKLGVFFGVLVLMSLGFTFVYYGLINFLDSSENPQEARVGSVESVQSSFQIPDPGNVIVEDSLLPDEVKPVLNDYKIYKVPAEEPKIIRIPSLGVSGMVQKVGLTKDNQIAVPANVNFMGWYIGSSIPGEKGLSIIDGHVSGRFTDGVFKNLDKAQAGQEILVEYGDGSVKKFEIWDTKVVQESQASEVLFEKLPDIESQLNLITCAGLYDRQAGGFEDRVIVVAGLVV